MAQRQRVRLKAPGSIPRQSQTNEFFLNGIKCLCIKLWNTAKKAGKATASNYWVGSEVEIQGMINHAHSEQVRSAITLNSSIENQYNL